MMYISIMYVFTNTYLYKYVCLIWNYPVRYTSLHMITITAQSSHCIVNFDVVLIENFIT